MSVVAFDTLKYASRLQAGGFSADQARAAAEAFAEATQQELATKSDIASLRAEIGGLRSEMKAGDDSLRTELKASADRLRTELKASADSLRTELKAEMASLKTELRAEIKEVANSVELAKRDMTIRLGGMLIAAVGVLLAAMRYMTLPGH